MIPCSEDQKESESQKLQKTNPIEEKESNEKKEQEKEKEKEYQFEEPKIIIREHEIWRQTKAFKNKSIQYQDCPFFQIKYRKKGEDFKKEDISENDEIITVQIQQVNTMKKQIGQLKQVVLRLAQYKGAFTIGSLIPEDVPYGGYTARATFNAVDCYDEMMGNIHLKVDYSQINNLKTWEDQFNEYHKRFQTGKFHFSISTLEGICKFIYSNKRKISVQDISQKRGFPTLIEISQQCENQILETNMTFRIGYIPQMTVKKVYLNLLQFFKRYAPQEANIDNVVFDGLQQIRSKVQFTGIDESLSQLFMLVQDRQLNRVEFIEKLTDESLMIAQKLYEAVDKPCILLQLSRDENPIEHFMLVADQKHNFTFGRMEFSDINFQSIQVSRNHGTIRFLSDKNQWIIMDGQSQGDEDNWKRSSFGVWFEMRPDSAYYLDSKQTIKIGQTQITLEPMNLKMDQKDMQELYDEKQLLKTRQIKQNKLINEILSF